ncbi:MAG: TraB/GumN family protein, partial [Vallitaleaceae bacterium]|nr:TraB/GumN family protein [Vallitaleaceae bacterium]
MNPWIKKLSKKVIALALAMGMAIVPVAAEETSAAETTAQVAESPAAWAIWDVQMTYTYGLGDESTYTGYAAELVGNELSLLESGIESRFSLDEEAVNIGEVKTRGDVVVALYDFINSALEIEGNADVDTALAYFVENGLVNGRVSGDYDLDASCTKQEMLVFANRAYEHMVYALGDEGKGAFWTVSDEDNTVYLLGSIHVADGSVYPLSKEILNSFAASDALVVEANVLMTNPEDVAYVQEIMYLEEGTTLDQLISEESYTAFAQIMDGYGIPKEMYSLFKPWYAAILVQNLTMTTDYSATMGIDMYFLQLAYNWKPIIELEGVKYQMDMFDGFSPELQEGYLVGALSGEETTNDQLAQMLGYWKTGNVEDLKAMVFAEVDETEIEKEFNEKLWDVRDQHMGESVAAMLSEDTEKDYFVIVGAGHMISDTGIVQYLQSLG